MKSVRINKPGNARRMFCGTFYHASCFRRSVSTFSVRSIVPPLRRYSIRSLVSDFIRSLLYAYTFIYAFLRMPVPVSFSGFRIHSLVRFFLGSSSLCFFSHSLPRAFSVSFAICSIIRFVTRPLSTFSTRFLFTQFVLPPLHRYISCVFTWVKPQCDNI